MVDFTQEEISKKIAKNDIFKKIFVLVIYIILVPVLVHNILVLINLMFNTKSAPSIFGVKTYVVASGSMEPTYNVGDVVILNEGTSTNIKEGDVISYWSGNEVITHRVKQVIYVNGEKMYIAQGDNNPVEDDFLIRQEDIEGKVVNSIKYIGNVYLFFNNAGAIIGLCVAYCVYVSITDKRKNLVRQKRRVSYQWENYIKNLGNV